MNPLISVLLPIAGSDYERVAISIQSIINQTLKNIELICIIDEPYDSKLSKLVLSFSSSIDPQIVILTNDRKSGISYSLNRAAKVAKADLIARMDSDDQSFSNRLELQYNFMQAHPEIVLVGMQAFQVNSERELIGISNKPLNHTQISRYAHYACPLIHPTWCIRKNVFFKLGGYLNIAPAQDYHFISKLLRAGFKLANLSVPGLCYTVREQSLSRKNIYTTISIANYIRRSIASGRNFDELIVEKIRKNKKSKYFEFLYKIRSFGLLHYKSKNLIYSILSSFVVCLSSMFHWALLLDTYALINIQFLRWKKDLTVAE